MERIGWKLSVTWAAGLLLFVAVGLPSAGCESVPECLHCGASEGGGGAGASSSSSGTPSSSSSGGSVECMAPSQCPGEDTLCATKTCVDGVCGFMFHEGPVTSQKFADCKQRVCDGEGNVIEVADSTDTASDAKECTDDTCAGGAPVNTPVGEGTTCKFNQAVCTSEGNCVECLDDNHCTADPTQPKCDENKCVPPGCADGTLNGLETDVDCGGPRCSPCDDGEGCAAPAHCLSGVCSGTPAVCQPGSCTDGIKNGSETSIDCGGSCPPCAVGGVCLSHADCESGVCYCAGAKCTSPNSLYVCLKPTCTDGTQNGAETGVDCGDPTNPDCLACPP